MTLHLIKKAKLAKKDPHLTFLHLDNAFDAIPHEFLRAECTISPLALAMAMENLIQASMWVVDGQ